MALVTPTVTRKSPYDVGLEYGEAIQVEWVLTSGGDIEGVPFVAPGFNDVTVQYTSSDWGGQILNFRGTLQIIATPTSWFNLTDGKQDVIAPTENGGKVVMENVYQYSPLLDGAPTANLTVLALFTKKGR